MSNAIHERLHQLRDSLLTLHKALVDSERVSYEKTVGAIQSPNHFFQLLTNDPWFAWLQPLSHLVVTMDEALDTKRKKPLLDTEAETLIAEAGKLLVPAEVGDGFSHHYFDALQRDPDVVMAHADATKFFHPRKSPPPI